MPLSKQKWNKRSLLWLALFALVVALLAVLIWLAARYEAEQAQNQIEREALGATVDLRAGLSRHIQSLQALSSPAQNLGWTIASQQLLHEHRELLMIELRNAHLHLHARSISPYSGDLALVEHTGSVKTLVGDAQSACERARRQSSPVYAQSQFVPAAAGKGQEIIALCMPFTISEQSAAKETGYALAYFSLQGLLTEMLAKSHAQNQEIAITEPDGTRLAIRGLAQRSGRMFSAQQILDLPGNTLVLRMDAWRRAPDLFPNVLTALVALMTLSLLLVLALLMRDMGRRMRAEKSLADALAFRKAMEDSLVTGLRARDMDGKISYVNPAFCAMTGFGADQLVGKTSPMPYWPPELANEYQERQAIRLSGNLPAREGYESVFQRSDGSRFPVLILEAPLIDARGQQTGWMSAVLDLSEQRQMEEQNRASQERLQATARLATVGEMASLLSHELNQPLAAISSYATGTSNMLLSPTQPNSQDISHAFARISEQAERAGRVIKSVHDFVRRRESKHEALAIEPLLDAIMPLVQLQARKLGVRIKTQVPKKLPAVHVDRTMIEQVLLNLCRNAMQAMETTPYAQRQLSLGARLIKPQDAAPNRQIWVELSVADRGAGIDEKTASQLFTPFFSTKAEGMGLGLSLCRTVIEQHGGHLRFEARPEPEGGGTVFFFTLPTLANVPTQGTSV